MMQNKNGQQERLSRAGKTTYNPDHKYQRDTVKSLAQSELKRRKSHKNQENLLLSKNNTKSIQR